VLGSLERFMGILIEHTAGALPFWCAPVQAVFVPINDSHVPYCRAAAEKMSAAGLRVKVDDSNASMGAKTREAQTQKIPFMLAVGDRELQASSFSVRKYGEKASATMSEGDTLSLFAKLNDPLSRA
jgi:threonyl-tRNA synthetase